MPNAAELARRSLTRPPGRTRLNAAAVGFEGGQAPAVESSVLPGVALCTRGEALGHQSWCDATFIAQVAAATNQLKCRFTHPGMSSDGLGKLVGHLSAGRADGNVARGDLTFSDVGRETPDGDLVGYVERLAAAHPKDFGLSVVFTHDWEAEEELLIANGAEWVEGRYGPELSLDNFVSPDPDNVHNLPHSRLKTLHACDVVDDPAANPDGLFHRGRADVAEEASTLADYVLGRSTVRPSLSSLGVDPDRARAFLARYLDARGLAVGAKEPLMPKPKNKPSLMGRLKSLFGATKTPKLSKEKEAMLSRVLSKFDDGEDPVPTEDRPPADVGDEPPPNTVETTCPQCGCEFPVDKDTGEAGEPTSMQDDDAPKDEQEDDEPKDKQDDSGEPDGKPDGKPDPHSANTRGSLQKYMKAFGDADGARYFADGLSFETAAAKYGAKMRTRLSSQAEKIKKLSAGDDGEDEPVELGVPEADLAKRREEAKAKLNAAPISRIAAGCVPKK